MPNLSGSFPTHPAVLRLLSTNDDERYAWAFLRLLLWAADRHPSGVIPESSARIGVISGQLDLEQSLVHNCVAERVPGGLRILDWSDFLPTSGAAVATAVAMPARDAVPYQAIVDAYHAALPDNPRVRVLSPATKGAIKGRWTEDQERRTLEWWQQYFTYAGGCAFLTGKGGGDRPFFADFQWLVGPKNMEKVINGRYES